MNAGIKILLFLLGFVSAAYSQNYSQTAAVVSAGGGNSANTGYQNFLVIGETLVNTYMSNSINNGTIGFIYQDDGQAVAPPLKAVLLYPQNNALLSNDPANPITITFYWIGQEGTSFRFQLSNNASFTNKMIDTVVDVNYFSVEIKVIGELYWHVQSAKGNLYADWSDTWKFNLLLTGINEEIDEVAIVYPNPAKSEIFISAPSDLIGGRIAITDIMGRIRYEQEISIINSIVNIGYLESGIYFIRLNKEGMVRYIKLVKD